MAFLFLILILLASRGNCKRSRANRIECGDLASCIVRVWECEEACRCVKALLDHHLMSAILHSSHWRDLSHFIRNSSVLDEESSSLTSVTSSRHLQRPIVQIYLYSPKIASYLPRQSSMKSLNGITERPQSKIEICTMSGSATLSPLLSYRIIKCSGTIAIRIAIAVLRVFSILWSPWSTVDAWNGRAVGRSG